MIRSLALAAVLMLLAAGGISAQSPAHQAAKSPYDGAMGHDFIPENQLMDGILDIMSRFSPYLAKQYVDNGKRNSQGDPYAGFKCQETMFSTEDGIRTASDLGMAAGFLFKYGRVNGIALPDGITYQQLYNMAMRSLVFVYSTHRSVMLARCLNNAYWGSSGSNEQFESSLWAMGMAYQAYFLWDSLSVEQRGHIAKVLKSESDFVLSCPIRCRYHSDTRAEENGWDVCVLAAFLGLFPDSAGAPIYFNRLRRLAINTLSYHGDKFCHQIIDPDYDTLSVSGAYVASNLFPDFTLQNHGRFHPGYQNVVVQELGEAALALRIFQQKTIGEERFRTQALMHNCKSNQDSVLSFLALPDGELAMPNGNDWSMFLFDQITSFSTLACFLRDPDALMLECQAFKNIRARQLTTSDGSFLLHSDLGARRMGVQAHRLILTYLMHLGCPTRGLRPSRWDDFCRAHLKSRIFSSQSLVRAASPDRTVFFSLDGNMDVSGYFVPNSLKSCKTVLPMPNGRGTGNFLGWYDVSDTYTMAARISRPSIQADSNSFCVCSEYHLNSSYLRRGHALYCTPGNAIISLDMAECLKGRHVVRREMCGALAISFDPFTSTSRVFYHQGGCDTIGVATKWMRPSGWLNIDNEIGILNFGTGKSMFLDSNALFSSISSRNLFMSYSDDTLAIDSGSRLGCHSQVYLSNVSAADTEHWQSQAVAMHDYLPYGWMGLACSDSRGTYVLIANLFGSGDAGMLSGMPLPEGQYFPVLKSGITIRQGKASSEIRLGSVSAQAFRAGFMIMASDVEAVPISDYSVRITALKDTKFSIAYSSPSRDRLSQRRAVSLKEGESRIFEWSGRRIVVRQLHHSAREDGQRDGVEL